MKRTTVALGIALATCQQPALAQSIGDIPPEVAARGLQQIGFRNPVVLWSVGFNQLRAILNSHSGQHHPDLAIAAFLASEGYFDVKPADLPPRFWSLVYSRDRATEGKITFENNGAILKVRYGVRNIGSTVFKNTFSQGPVEVRSARFQYSIKSDFSDIPSVHGLQATIVAGKSPTTGLWSISGETGLDARDRGGGPSVEVLNGLRTNASKYIARLDSLVRPIQKQKNAAIAQVYSLQPGRVVVDRSTGLSWAICNVSGFSRLPTRAQLLTLIDDKTKRWKFLSPDRTIENALFTQNISFPVSDAEPAGSGLYRKFRWLPPSNVSNGRWYDTLGSDSRPLPTNQIGYAYLCVK